MSEIKCEKCGNWSLTFDTFMDLSLPIASKSSSSKYSMGGSSSYSSSYSSYGESSVSLSDCLDEFAKVENLDTDYKCEKCKSGNCKRWTSIYTLPKILVIHLKWFSFTSSYKKKISTSVNFPLTGLNLSDYCESK